MQRREFLKTLSLLSAGAVLGLNGVKVMAKENNAGIPMRILGKDFKVSALGLGCMGMSANHGKPRDKKEMINLIAKANDAGITFYDTAEIYGPHTNEELLGVALKPFRKKVAIGTKFGLYYPNGKQVEDARPETIRKAIEGSLKRLQTDYIDIYYQHRVDNKIPIEEVAGTMKDLVKEGKLLHWGISEPNIETIKRAHKEFPITALLRSISIDTSSVEAFKVPAGTAVQLYETSLHYAPCQASKSEGFKVVIVLPRGTNTAFAEHKVIFEEDKLLRARNKWLLAHKESNEAKDGAVIGLTGENIDIGNII